jgi:hypothetical protein
MRSRSSISRNHTSHRAAYRSRLGVRLAVWYMAGVHTTTHRGG